MEILSSRPQPLTIEARHTISQEVSKQRRLKVAKSLFLPSKSPRKTVSKTKENAKEKSVVRHIETCKSMPSSTKRPNRQKLVTHTSNQELGVISDSSANKFSQLASSTQTSRTSNSKRRGTSSTRRSSVKKVPKNKDPPKKKDQSSSNRLPSLNANSELPSINSSNVLPSESSSNNLPVQSTVTTSTTPCQPIQLPPQIDPPPMNNDSIFNFYDEIIEISSDEEDIKVFSQAQSPPWQLPKQNNSQSGLPLQSIPDIPRQHTPGIRMPTYTEGENQQISTYIFPPPILCPFINYQQIPGCYQAPPANYQPGFYTESYSNPPRQPPTTASNQNYLTQDKRHIRKPSAATRRSKWDTSHPQAPQAPQVPQAPQAPQLHQSNSNYLRNLPSAAGISRWMAPRFNQPHPTQQSAPMPPEQPSQQALIPYQFNNDMKCFYERLNEIHQAELARQNRQILSSQSTSTQAHGIVPRPSVVRPTGNTSNNSSALTRRRMENDPGPMNLIMQQSRHQTQQQMTPPHPVVQADSTTGNSSPPATTNASTAMVLRNFANMQNNRSIQDILNAQNIQNRQNMQSAQNAQFLANIQNFQHRQYMANTQPRPNGFNMQTAHNNNPRPNIPNQPNYNYRYPPPPAATSHPPPRAPNNRPPPLIPSIRPQPQPYNNMFYGYGVFKKHG